MKFYLFLLLFLGCFLEMQAQITTSRISGRITDVAGGTLPGATVVATHLPTGTRYAATANATGQYHVPDVRPGGPYTLEIVFLGFETARREALFASLGAVLNLDFILRENNGLLGEVLVKINKNDAFQNGQTGAQTSVGSDMVQKLPTLNRSLQDVTRLAPQAAGNSFAGTNYRYNNLSIDGAAHNDVFGFTEPTSGAGGSQATGTPGSLARTQPISLDAIQEVQVSVSPFDVKSGNFTGGSVNAITRSGTNQTEGSVYGYGRNQWLTGRSPDALREPIAQYFDFITGARLGGAIKKDKLFYFVNAERSQRKEPVLFAPGQEGSGFNLPEMQALADTLLRRYNYDAGTLGDYQLRADSWKVFARVDWNISPRHQLAIRHSYVAALADNFERGPNILNFGSQAYTHFSTTNSSVLELKTRLGGRLSNVFILGHNYIHDRRETPGDLFPHVEITYNTTGTIFLGSYREAIIYGLKLRTFEMTDNLSLYLNRHTLTFGTHNELYRINYPFLTAWNGRWAYRSITDFYANRPSRIRGVYNQGDNSLEFNKQNPSAEFGVGLYSVYAQDEWAISRRMTLNMGLRAEFFQLTDPIPINPKVVATPAFNRYRNDFPLQCVLAPRIGFRYQAVQDKVLLRGGTGIFTARLPFNWLAYPYYNDGQRYGNVDVRPTGVTPIAAGLPQLEALQPGLAEVNLLDNQFKMPRVWRSSVAVDWRLPDDYVFSVEGIFTQNIFDVLYQTINLKDSVSTVLGGPDARPIYLGSNNAKKVNPDFTNVFLLTNTRQGYRYSLSASIRKNFSRELTASAAYTYGISKDLVNGVRNSPQANWEWNQTTHPNEPVLSFSNFDTRHNAIATAAYTHCWNKVHTTSITVFHQSRSGRPFSFVYAGDLNGDGSPNNDLIFIPKNADDIVLTDIKNGAGQTIVTAADQWRQLDAYISSNSYLGSQRGSYAARNGGRTPWGHQTDVRLLHKWDFPSKKHRRSVEISLDIMNAANLFNYNWGRQYFVSNTTNAGYQLLTYNRIANNRATFSFNNPSNAPWQIDPIASRWQMQLGARVNF